LNLSEIISLQELQRFSGHQFLDDILSFMNCFLRF
jgi:hypothetical protein